MIIWNATMPIWIGVLIVVPLVLLAIVGFAGWIHAERRDHSAYWKMDKALAETRVQRDRLNRENDTLHTAISDQAETIAQQLMELQEAQASLKDQDREIERLHQPDLATLPLQEAVQPKPQARPKRGKIS